MATQARTSLHGLIDRLHGPREAKRRAEILLASLSGTVTVADACAELGVGRSRSHVLRRRMLRGMLDAAAGTTASPREAETDPALLRAHHARIEELEGALQFTVLQSDIALAAPKHRRSLRKHKTLGRARRDFRLR